MFVIIIEVFYPLYIHFYYFLHGNNFNKDPSVYNLLSFIVNCCDLLLIKNIINHLVRYKWL